MVRAAAWQMFLPCMRTERASALILQANSSGVVVSDEDFARLLDTIIASQVLVDVWVGPSGSRLTGKAAQLVGAADLVGMAPGTRLGDTGTPVTQGLDTDRMAPITDRTVNSCPMAAVLPACSVNGSITAAAPTPTHAVRSVDLARRPLERASFIRFSVAFSVRSCASLIGPPPAWS